jgi:trigger factor
MLVKQEELNPCEVELEVEVDVEKVKSAIDSTYDDIAKETTVPGFRKGKAPRVVLRNYLDPDKVMSRAREGLLREAYSEALEESKLEPYGPADLHDVKFEDGEPLKFKAKVPLQPRVEIGQYIGLEIERPLHEVTDEEVDKQVEALREREAEWSPVSDRAIKEGDAATVKLSREDGEGESEQPPIRVIVDEGTLPEFREGLVGMKTGDTKTIEVTYPEDYGAEELRGQTRKWNVEVVSVEEKNLPELTDEWVKATYGGEETPGAEGGDDAERIDTVEKLKARIRSGMERGAMEEADQAVRDAVVEKVIKGSTICFPEFMVDESVDVRLRELAESLSQRKLTVEDYLKHTNQTVEQIQERYKEESRNYLELLLAFREIVEKEKIEVTDEDFNAELEAAAQQRGTTPEAMRAYVEKSNSEESIRNRILRKKVVDFLVHASNIKNVGS